MTAFFDDPSRQAKLRAEVAAWVGTPFKVHAAVKRAAVDCVRLTAEIMVACGVIESYKFPPYTLQWAKHQDRSIVTEWLDACPQMGRLPKEEPVRIGDVVCFKIGRCVHHVGVVLDAPEFLNAVEGARVSICRLDDSTWSKRLACVYRPMGSGSPALQNSLFMRPLP